MDDGFVFMTQQTNIQDNKFHRGSRNGELNRRHCHCQPGLSIDETKTLELKEPSKKRFTALDT
jgi:hypothetical protein